MDRGVTESVVEDAALAWLEAAGWRITHGSDITPDTPGAERRDYGEVVLALSPPRPLLPSPFPGELAANAVAGPGGDA